MYLPSGSSRTRYTVSFRTNGLLSELFFAHPDPHVNQVRWEALASQREALEDAFGGPLILDDLPGRKGCRIGVERSGGETIDNRSHWQDHLTWFEDGQARLRTAVLAVGGIPPLPTGSPDTDEPDGDLD